MDKALKNSAVPKENVNVVCAPSWRDKKERIEYNVSLLVLLQYERSSQDIRHQVRTIISEGCHQGYLVCTFSYKQLCLQSRMDILLCLCNLGTNAQSQCESPQSSPCVTKFISLQSPAIKQNRCFAFKHLLQCPLFPHQFTMSYLLAFNMASPGQGLCLPPLRTARRHFSLLRMLSKPQMSLKDPLTGGCSGSLKHC